MPSSLYHIFAVDDLSVFHHLCGEALSHMVDHGIPRIATVGFDLNEAYELLRIDLFGDLFNEFPVLNRFP